MAEISVILPVYNRAAVVGRAIESVLAQEFSDFELVVVDDGSTDRSADVVRRYADRRIKLIRLVANQGGNAARNRGIAVSTAPLVTFLDSDDWFLPHKLGFEVRRFAERSDVDVLLTGFVYSEESRSEGKRRRPNPVIESNAEFVEALFMRRLRKGTPGIAVRRSALERVGGFDEGLRRRQDFDLLLRLAQVARCATTGEMTWVKEDTPDSISADKGKFIQALIPFLRRHPEYHHDARYRRGFAIDVGRHLSWHLARRRMAVVARDLRLLREELGTAKLARLLLEASYRYPAFRQRRRRDRRQA